MRAGYPELFWRPADGTGSDERLLDACERSPQSARRRLVGRPQTAPVYRGVVEHRSRDRADRHRAPVRCEGAGEKRVRQRPSRPCHPMDAGWPTSRTCPVETEIYIERYPELGNRQPISTGGGRLPLWSRDGQELFFSSLDGRQMFAVAVQSGTTLVAGRPRVLFEFAMLPIVGSSRPYDIAPDGRFVIIRSGQGDASGGRQRSRSSLCRTGSRS